MDYELRRNGSGYYDPTAYEALRNYQRGGSGMEFKRGEIFEYEQVNRVENRLALVVSADFRAGDRYISIILLTEEPKGQINVPIRMVGGIMYADCGMVSVAVNDRLFDFKKTATDAEMAQVDEGIAKCLGLEQKMVEKVVEVPVEKIVEVQKLPVTSQCSFTEEGFHSESMIDVEKVEELAAAKAEANVYKNLYEQLLAKMIG